MVGRGEGHARRCAYGVRSRGARGGGGAIGSESLSRGFVRHRPGPPPRMGPCQRFLWAIHMCINDCMVGPSACMHACAWLWSATAQGVYGRCASRCPAVPAAPGRVLGGRRVPDAPRASDSSVRAAPCLSPGASAAGAAGRELEEDAERDEDIAKVVRGTEGDPDKIRANVSLAGKKEAPIQLCGTYLFT